MKIIAPDHELPLIRQCHILEEARSVAYHPVRPVSDSDSTLIRHIDGLVLHTRLLEPDNYACSCVRVQKIRHRQVAAPMKRVVIELFYRNLKFSRRHPTHVARPSPSRNLSTSRANEEWAADITYLSIRLYWPHGNKIYGEQ